MATQPFIFDASKGETPESVAYKRQIAARLMGNIRPGQARNVGEGIGNALASLGSGFAARGWNNAADEGQRAGQEGATSMTDQLREALTTGKPITPGGSPVGMGDLLQYASNPWLNEGQRAVVNAYMKREMDASDPMRQLDMDYKRAQIGKLQSEASGKGDGVFGTPIYGQDPETGQTALGVIGKDGTFRRIDTGGVRVTPGVTWQNTGTDFVPMDTKTGAQVGPAVPINNARKAADAATGKAQGEAAASYRSMVSKMPGLEKVVGELNTLADQATYTIAGQAMDFGRAQAGMEPRDAAVARTQYISMVDNQILPLLRDTFGAQFTKAEGDSLRATLGDPDKTPPEKKAVLNSFIEQKRRDVEALALQAMSEDGQSSAAPPPAEAPDYRSKYGLE